VREHRGIILEHLREAGIGRFCLRLDVDEQKERRAVAMDAAAVRPQQGSQRFEVQALERAGPIEIAFVMSDMVCAIEFTDV
jgi:hypothetical protein